MGKGLSDILSPEWQTLAGDMDACCRRQCPDWRMVCPHAKECRTWWNNATKDVNLSVPELRQEFREMTDAWFDKRPG